MRPQRFALRNFSLQVAEVVHYQMLLPVLTDQDIEKKR